MSELDKAFRKSRFVYIFYMLGVNTLFGYMAVLFQDIDFGLSVLSYSLKLWISLGVVIYGVVVAIFLVWLKCLVRTGKGGTKDPIKRLSSESQVFAGASCLFVGIGVFLSVVWLELLYVFLGVFVALFFQIMYFPRLSDWKAWVAVWESKEADNVEIE